jgi:hypothetical protein
LPPLAVRAEQPALPVIGLLSSVPFDTLSDEWAAFRRGLAETGHVEGANVAFEYRTAIISIGCRHWRFLSTAPRVADAFSSFRYSQY